MKDTGIEEQISERISERIIYVVGKVLPLPQECIPEHPAEEIIDVHFSATDGMNDRAREARFTEPGAGSHRGANRGHTVESSMIRRSPQGHPSRVRATVAQMRRAMKVADKQSMNTVAKMCTGFGKVGSEPGEEAVIMGASMERNLEQSLAMKKEMPSETQDLWQLVENLREEMQRLEEKTKRRFTAQT